MCALKFNPLLKVVTVEDSPIVVERIQGLLDEMSQIEYSGNARNIAEALKLVAQTKPDVVIMDIHLEEDMPSFNGIHLLAMLRQLYEDMKIIMLTNLSEPQYRVKCYAFGANYFFDKSNEFERIQETLRIFLSKKSTKKFLKF